MDSESPGIALRDRRLLAENQVFRIYFDHLEGAGGTEERNYLVVAPKIQSENQATGVSVLPIKENKAGLLRLHRHAINAETWEAPRGFADKGESGLQAARRELEEEAGLRAEPHDIQSLGFITLEASLHTARIHLYLVERRVPIRAFEPRELGHHALQWFDLEEALAMVDRGEIHDPSTLITLYHYKLRAHNSSVRDRL